MLMMIIITTVSLANVHLLHKAALTASRESACLWALRVLSTSSKRLKPGLCHTPISPCYYYPHFTGEVIGAAGGCPKLTAGERVQIQVGWCLESGLGPVPWTL